MNNFCAHCRRGQRSDQRERQRFYWLKSKKNKKKGILLENDNIKVHKYHKSTHVISFFSDFLNKNALLYFLMRRNSD